MPSYKRVAGLALTPSMKVPPKRKGNLRSIIGLHDLNSLNESPSEKEGKFNFQPTYEVHSPYPQ